MKVHHNGVTAVLAALLLVPIAGAQAAGTRHHPKPHRKPAKAARSWHKRVLPVPASVKVRAARRTPEPPPVPATPAPKTPGATPQTPPVVTNGSSDTRTPMTPPGIAGTGVPGPGTQP